MAIDIAITGLLINMFPFIFGRLGNLSFGRLGIVYLFGHLGDLSFGRLGLFEMSSYLKD